MKRIFVVSAALLMSFASSARAQDIPAEYQHWGTGPADKLATSFKAALGELGKAKTATATKQ